MKRKWRKEIFNQKMIRKCKKKKDSDLLCFVSSVTRDDLRLALRNLQISTPRAAPREVISHMHNVTICKTAATHEIQRRLSVCAGRNSRFKLRICFNPIWLDVEKKNIHRLPFGDGKTQHGGTSEV